MTIWGQLKGPARCSCTFWGLDKYLPSGSFGFQSFNVILLDFLRRYSNKVFDTPMKHIHEKHVYEII